MRQRVMIAMALMNDPKLLIADEPTTALDVTVQAQILEVLQRLQHELDTAIVMITHDLGVVAEIADEIAVMYAGRIVEHAPKDAMFAAPEHPYTWGLLRSIPRLDLPRDEPLVPIPGRPPSLINPPSGCAFHPRCPYVRESHKRVDPKLADDRERRPSPRRLPAAARDAARAVAAAAGRGDARRGQAGRAHPRGRRRPGGGALVSGTALFEIRDLVKHFPLTRGIVFQRQVGAVQAVDGVSLRRHARVRRSAWWASRAAASPRRRAC